MVMSLPLADDDDGDDDVIRVEISCLGTPRVLKTSIAELIWPFSLDLNDLGFDFYSSK